MRKFVLAESVVTAHVGVPLEKPPVDVHVTDEGLTTKTERGNLIWI